MYPTLHSTYIPADFRLTSWESLEPHFTALENEEITSVAGLEEWLVKLSQWEAQVHEEKAWRHIRMTCNTQDAAVVDAYQDFVNNIYPPMVIAVHRMVEKALALPFFRDLNDAGYMVLKRSFVNEVEIFNEESVPLISEATTLARHFDRIAGSLQIEHEGEKLTLQQSALLLESPDRKLREKAWRAASEARGAVRTQLHNLFSQLIEIRTRISALCGFPSFTDYAYRQMERYDYGRAEAEDFRNSIALVVRPLYEAQLKERCELLGLERLRPWDLAVDLSGGKVLAPFGSTEELVTKSIAALTGVSPQFGSFLREMKERGLLDLDSRMGKSPGGYNYPLPVTGAPFIFMNAANSWNDVVTMMHESGHAVQSFLMRDINLFPYRDVPSEMAELASMSMELFSLDFLGVFYPEAADLKRARLEQVTRMIVLLPWIAAVDHFQHWVYDNPAHSVAERNREWRKIYERYHGTLVDWTGLEDELDHFWQKQGHLYRSPFYYIEYGIAQLGAVAVWRNYRRDPVQAIELYKKALALGNSRPLPEVYRTAGVQFDFSAGYITELMDFLQEEIRKMKSAD